MRLIINYVLIAENALVHAKVKRLYENGQNSKTIIKITVIVYIGKFTIKSLKNRENIQRRRSLAVLRSIGLGKKQMVQMIFIESFFSGIIGGGIGVFGGWVTIYIAPFLTKSLIATIPMHIH